MKISDSLSIPQEDIQENSDGPTEERGDGLMKILKSYLTTPEEQSIFLNAVLETLNGMEI